MSAMLLGVIGGSIPLRVADGVGLYVAPKIFRPWLGTIDAVTVLFVIMWTTSLAQFGVHGEAHYEFRLFRRFRRSRLSDVAIPMS